jgi:hypothetical protein
MRISRYANRPTAAHPLHCLGFYFPAPVKPQQGGTASNQEWILNRFDPTNLVVFVLAYFFVDFEGGHLTFKHRSQHPTSMLVNPGSPQYGATSVSGRSA